MCRKAGPSGTARCFLTVRMSCFAEGLQRQRGENFYITVCVPPIAQRRFQGIRSSGWLSAFLNYRLKDSCDIPRAHFEVTMEGFENWGLHY
jgi:hypothetical protein